MAFVEGYAVHGVIPPLPRISKALVDAQAVLEAHTTTAAWQFVEAKATIEGVYSNIYQRRDRLWNKYDRRIRKWTARLALDVPVDSLVADILAHTSLVINEATSKKQRETLKQIVLAALLGVLSRYADLRTEAQTLAAAARAEGTALGTTAAAALIAFLNGNPVPSMDKLQKETLAELQQSTSYWSDTLETVNQMLEGLAGDIATGLAPLVNNGANRDAVEAYLINTIGAGVGAAFYLDTAIHAAFALAILAAIVGQGGLVDFVTVGDARVCVACADAEANNPWKPDDVPPIPNHGGCRCWYAPAQ